METSNIDYKLIGLKVGLEIHQQLDTKYKLFCRCPTVIQTKPPDYVFRRILKPTQSELGEIDRAAVFEAEKSKVFVYHSFYDSSCMVEHDEEPPHPINEEAVDIALIVSLTLNALPVDEIHVMRKIVIDGSNTCGFQRTAIIALGGYISDVEGDIPIQTVVLEEDAARKIEENSGEVRYSLDRLGIPLIEIATAPVISTPQQAQRVAFKIGQLLRMTGRVKRGIGTIRQDLNVSITGGAKTEIKGVQELEIISKCVEYEVQRQLTLLKIRDELLNRGVENKLVFNPIDVTSIFTNTKCRIIRDAVSSNGRVYALKLPSFKGILKIEVQPKRRFGTELSDRAKALAGVNGIFHTDELPAYGITEDEVKRLLEAVSASQDDAVVFVASQEHKALKALKAVYERCIEALKGVPEETRAANSDGTTYYTRPRPGAARLYPETDIPPLAITKERIERLKTLIPETPERKFERFTKVLKLSSKLAQEILNSYYLPLFERIVSKYNVNPTIVASTLTSTLTSLRRDGVNIDLISDERFEEIFKLLQDGIIAKESIPDIIRFLSADINRNVIDIVREKNLFAMPREKVEEVIREMVLKNINVIAERKGKAVDLLIGQAMKTLRGKVDGGVVRDLIVRIVNEIIGGE
jgi:glutamyl-tRNA(Gln) amidotransferase subunit E